MARPLARDESALSDWIVLLALVIAVIVVLGAYFVVFAPKPLPAGVVAQQGDQVQIDYVGSFQNDDLVFDTSLHKVALDNASYPKSFSFSWKSGWTPLQFTIGDGSVVKGFDRGVRGLAVGQTTTLVVPASLGYGAADPAKVSVHGLSEALPVRRTMNETAFRAYYHQAPVSGTNVTDPVYGWSVGVTILNGLVTVANSPYPSEAVRPYGSWDAVVLSVDDTANNGIGAITVQNHLDATLVDRIGGKTPDGKTFYLSAVDAVGGTYTLDFNGQIIGRTLVFQVTLVSLSRPY